jgi:hypothetical protein
VFSEKKINISDELEDLYASYFSDDKCSFKKLAFKIFMKDDITFSFNESKIYRSNNRECYFEYKTQVNMITKKFGSIDFDYFGSGVTYKTINNMDFIFGKYIENIENFILKQKYSE